MGVDEMGLRRGVRLKREGIDWEGKLAPRRDRRYIVVGESEFLGGQIILHLLAMGTPPEAIRILDAPETLESYEAPWLDAVAGLPLTVFHTAGVIRPFERYGMFYERTSRVNVTGMAHSLQAAKKVGAGIFIYTSSSNAALRQVKWLFAPWARTQQPRGFIQDLDNRDFFEPLRPPHTFPTNYAQSKAESKRLVCSADERDVRPGMPGLRTGAVRPGNAVYGHRNDKIVGKMLGIGNLPTLPDRGKPVRFDDIYLLLDTVSTTGLRMSYPPPVLMLVLSYLVEWYGLLVNAVPFLDRFLSEPGEPIRRGGGRRKGGIGYVASCTTVEGMCAQVVDLNKWVEGGMEMDQDKKKLPWWLKLFDRR
ncbi:hypothetical protein J3F84DRAFT_394829 [Trichoderma pleuroticola]